MRIDRLRPDLHTHGKRTKPRVPRDLLGVEYIDWGSSHDACMTSHVSLRVPPDLLGVTADSFRVDSVCNEYDKYFAIRRRSYQGKIVVFPATAWRSVLVLSRRRREEYNDSFQIACRVIFNHFHPNLYESSHNVVGQTSSSTCENKTLMKKNGKTSRLFHHLRRARKDEKSGVFPVLCLEAPKQFLFFLDLDTTRPPGKGCQRRKHIDTRQSITPNPR